MFFLAYGWTIMKWPKSALIMALVLSGIVSSGPVLAAGGGHGRYYGGHGGYHGGVRFGVYLGGPVFWPGYYYPPAYFPRYYSPYYPPYYPPVVVPPSPSVYIEQGSSQTAPAPSNWWYYCADSNAYYPYVKECPAGWQRVAPLPASLSGTPEP
jgi:hypothetical protein